MLNRLQAAFQAFHKPPVTDAYAQMAEQVQRDAKHLAQLSAELLQDGRYTAMKQLYDRIVEQNVRLLLWYNPPPNHPQPLVAFYETMRTLQLQLRPLVRMVGLPKDFVAKAEEKPSPLPPNPANAFQENGKAHGTA